MFPSGMAIQDLAIFTMLGFVVLPSFTLSRSYYIVMAVFTAVLFGCIAPMVCSIDSSTVSWCTSLRFASGRSSTTLVLGFLFKF